MTFVGATSAGDFVDEVTVDVPAGVRDGDRMLLLVTSNDAVGITPPAGWSLVMEEVFEGNGVGNWVFEREASSEPADYTVGFGGEHWQFAVVAVWRGHGPVSTVEHVNDSDVTSIDLPSVQARAGDVLVAFGFNWNDTPKTWSPSGLSEVVNLSRAIIASYEQPPAGPTEPYTLTAEDAGVMGATAILVPALPLVAPVATPERGQADPAPEWRFYAQRVLTGEWLHRELPLSNVQITPSLSGPYEIRADIEPVFAELLGEDGLPVLQEKATLIYAEAAGQLRGGGILTRADPMGDTLSLEIDGVSAYATDQPLTSTLTWGGSDDGTSGHGVDPLTVVRALWDHLQAQPDGDLGVTYTATTSDYSLGAWHNARALDEDGSLGDDPKAIEDPPPPIDKVWTGSDEKPAAAKGKTVWWRYRLAWWDGVDIGRKVEELAQQAPFDWREHYAWADGSKESVVMELQFGYPRLGRRNNKRFVEDENVSEVVPVSRDTSDWANEVVALGSGEGSKQIRQTARRRDGRLRTARTIDRPEISNKASLKAQATDELLRYYHLDDITKFTIRDHPNAPIGSFEVGDDVFVECRAWGRWVRMWVRILSYTYDPDDPTGQIDITCSRSDRFRYGGAIW